MALGTLPYMSPEQVQGKAVDHRTDIFSLGVVLHEMATAQRPFHGENSASLTSSILRDEPEPVTERNPGLPEHLGDVICRCLEKSPGQRYPSAQELHDDLMELQNEVKSGQTAVTRTVSRPTRFGGGARLAIAAVLILALVAGIIWILNRGAKESAPGVAEASQIRSLVVLPLRNMSGDPEQALFRRRHDRGADYRSFEDRRAEGDFALVGDAVQGHG